MIKDPSILISFLFVWQEGIDWEMVDFGMDLQSCITMFEKPLGNVTK
jgi:hypothetical protein